LKPENQSCGSPCSLVRRLAIIVYDTAIVVGLLMLATMLSMLAGFEGQTALMDPVYTIYLFLVWFFYIAGCWHAGGMTVGMRAWRVRIEDEQGNNPDWKKSSIRFAVSLLSAAVAGAGFFWSVTDRDKRCWHDMLSATRLIRY